jgi:hypothetical protein
MRDGETVKIGRMAQAVVIASNAFNLPASADRRRPPPPMSFLAASQVCVKTYVSTRIANSATFRIATIRLLDAESTKFYAKCQHANEKSRFPTSMFP